MAPPPNPYKRRPLSPVRYPTLPWVPNKKQRQSAHQPNDEKKKSNDACLGDEHDDDESDKDTHVPPLFFRDSWNGSRLLSHHDDRPRSSPLSDKRKERRLENHDDVEMNNKHAVEGGRSRRMGGGNHPTRQGIVRAINPMMRELWQNFRSHFLNKNMCQKRLLRLDETTATTMRGRDWVRC